MSAKFLKRNILLSQLFFIINTGFTQSTFFHKFNNYNKDSFSDYGMTVIATKNNEYILGGNTYNPITSYHATLIIKTNCNGDTLWMRVFDLSTALEPLYSICETTGGYAGAGQMYDSTTGNSQAYVVKVDYSGNLLWFKTYGIVAGQDCARKILSMGDGGFAIAGYQSNSTGPWDGFMMKIDSAGNLQWNQSYGCINDDFINSMSMTNDGGFILSGYSYCTMYGDADTWLLKTDSNGNTEWEKKYGITNSGDGGGSAIQTLDGGYVLYSNREPNGTFNDPYLVKTDPSGNIEWIKTYTDTLANIDEFFESLKQLPDSGYVICGKRWINSLLTFDAWLVRTDKNGDSLWTKTFGNPTMDVPDYFYDIDLISDGGFIIGGVYNNIGYPYQDAWLLKVDSNGCVDSACSLDCITCDFIVPGILCSYDTFTTSISADDSIMLQFWDTNSVARSRLWEFGDGYTSGTRYTTHVYSEGGTYTVTLTDVYGSCNDTVMKTIVIIEPPPLNDSVTTAICDGDSIYLSGSWQKAGGSYYDTIIVPYAPDTARITTLTISPTATATAAATICMGDSIFLSGSWQKAGGTYSDTFTTVNGCDSIITTTLTVNQSAGGSQQLAICSGDSVFLSGSWQKAGGSYYDTLTTVNGCDSVIETALAIDPLPLIDSLTVEHASGPNDSDGTATVYVSSGTPPYTFMWSNGQWATDSAQSTINNLWPDTYTVCITDSNGCAPVQGCGSAVVSYVVGGAPLNPPKGGREVTLYPNPVGDEFTVEVNLPANENITIELYDIMGREIIPPLGGRGQKGEKFKKTFTTGEINNGIYFMQVKGGNFSEVVKVAILH